jgi:hypothetical protein
MAVSQSGRSLRERSRGFPCDHEDQKLESIKPFPFHQWADIYVTDKLISVEPMSGYRHVLPEDEGDVTYLPIDATDEMLGRVLLSALDKSRFIWPFDEPEFFKWQRYMQCFKDRENDFMRQHGYKTKRALYKNMKWCRAKKAEAKISIQPHQRREKPGEWKWLPPQQNIIIPETHDAAAVGSALRLAFDRCE